MHLDLKNHLLCFPQKNAMQLDTESLQLYNELIERLIMF